MAHLTEQASHSVDLPGDEEVLVQAHAVEAEEVDMAIVAMVPTRDLLTDPERRPQTQNTLRAKIMAITVLEDQEALAVVDEEDTGVDGATTDTEVLLPQEDYQVGLI